MELSQIFDLMDLNNIFSTRERTSFSGVEGFCVLAHRLAFPVRLLTLAKY
jgi:hypothetical protein